MTCMITLISAKILLTSAGTNGILEPIRTFVSIPLSALPVESRLMQLVEKNHQSRCLLSTKLFPLVSSFRCVSHVNHFIYLATVSGTYFFIRQYLPNIFK